MLQLTSVHSGLFHPYHFFQFTYPQKRYTDYIRFCHKWHLNQTLGDLTCPLGYALHDNSMGDYNTVNHLLCKCYHKCMKKWILKYIVNINIHIIYIVNILNSKRKDTLWVLASRYSKPRSCKTHDTLWVTALLISRPSKTEFVRNFKVVPNFRGKAWRHVLCQPVT